MSGGAPSSCPPEERARQPRERRRPSQGAFPYLGHGLGLRLPHYERALRGALEADWIEVITENFFGGGGRPRAVLEAVRRERPLVFHGVSLGIGSRDPPDAAYLRQVKALADAFEPAWISDHVCWTRHRGRHAHELLPLPYTAGALQVAVENTERVQDVLGRPLLLENVSSYVAYRASEMPEWEFLAELARRSGCALLLDLNNVLVSAHHHAWSPSEYLLGLPRDKVAQFHLANHSQREGYAFDDHRGPVPDVVWELYEAALRRFGPISSLIEWDEEIPAWPVLVRERDQAAVRAQSVLGEPLADEGPYAGWAHGARAERARGDGPADGVPTVERAVSAPNGGGPVPQAPPLEEIQRLFFDALIAPRGVRHFAETSEATRRALEQTFASGPRLGHLERLDIYANAYFYRLLDALRGIFPRLARLAGDAAFHDLVTDYVLASPSTAPDLRRLGDALPAFLRAHPLGRNTPLLVDLAELELALAVALDAPNAELLSRVALAQLPPERWPALELELAPSTRLLGSAYDLPGVVSRCNAGDLEGALALPAPTHPLDLMIGRRGFSAFFRALDPLERVALDEIGQGGRFDALCERLAARGAAPATLLGYLQRWLDEEAIAACHG